MRTNENLKALTPVEKAAAHNPSKILLFEIFFSDWEPAASTCLSVVLEESSRWVEV